MNHISETDKIILPEDTIYIDTFMPSDELEKIIINIIS